MKPKTYVYHMYEASNASFVWRERLAAGVLVAALGSREGRIGLGRLRPAQGPRHRRWAPLFAPEAPSHPFGTHLRPGEQLTLVVRGASEICLLRRDGVGASARGRCGR